MKRGSSAGSPGPPSVSARSAKPDIMLVFRSLSTVFPVESQIHGK